MRIAFINPNADHDYNAKTPWIKGLGGSESAQVYLAIAMAQKGHEIFLYSGTRDPGTHHGVNCCNIEAGLTAPDFFDVLIVTNNSRTALALRRISHKPVIIAWEHNLWCAQPPESPLAFLTGPRDIVLCVSHWHSQHFVDHGGLDSSHVRALNNAISPWFEDIAGIGHDFDKRCLTPELYFTSVPVKGLKQALGAFFLLRQNICNARLRVFSGYSHYSPGDRKNRWNINPGMQRRRDGLVFHDVVSQKRLAQAMQRGWILFYPCTIRETSSIVAMEAMAAGLAVLATPLGALPETAAGFGFFAGFDQDGNLSLQRFAQEGIVLCKRFLDRDPALSAHLNAQMEYVRSNYTWSRRADELESLITSIDSGVL